MNKKEFLKKVNGTPWDIEEVAYEALNTDDSKLKRAALIYLNSKEAFWEYLQIIGYEAK